MLKKLLIASVAGLALAACQQPQSNQPQAYTVYFNTGQSALSAEANATVSQAAAAFRQGGTAIGVRGHTDTVGNATYNLQLSLQRARAAARAAGLHLDPALDVSLATHLVSQRRAVTPKLLEALLAGRPVVAVAWLEAVAAWAAL